MLRADFQEGACVKWTWVRPTTGTGSSVPSCYLRPVGLKWQVACYILYIPTGYNMWRRNLLAFNGFTVRVHRVAWRGKRSSAWDLRHRSRFKGIPLLTHINANLNRPDSAPCLTKFGTNLLVLLLIFVLIKNLLQHW